MANDYILRVGTKIDGTDIQKQLNQIPKSQRTTTVYVKGDSKELKTVYQDGNKTYETFSKVNKEGQVVSTTLKRVKESADNTGKSLKEASTHTNTLASRFVDITKKVAAFGAVTSIIGLFTGAMYKATEAIKENDAAITDFKKVSDLSGDSLDKYSQRLGELGKTVARTRTEMIESATEFKRSSYSDEDAARLSKIAELYKNVADVQLTSGESASFVISQMKAFNIEADDAITIIDELNAVSNNFAVSSSDVATGLTKSSASLAAYGNTMSESMSLITAGSEVMINQSSRVSRGLVSIGANIVKLANKTGELQYTINGATKSISLFDSVTGEMKNTYQVLSEVATGWDTMSTAEQSALALSLAG